jgi:hypothetical protein
MKDGPGYQMSATSEGALGLQRILDLETKLARMRVVGRKRRELVKAIRVAAAAYRMALDNEQTTATHDSNLPGLTGRAPRSFPTRKTLGLKRSC